MAPEEFEIWLVGVERLDFAQVGRAVLALMAIESRARGVGDTPGEAKVEPVGRTNPEPVEVETVASIVHRRVEVSGCPHCQSHEIVGWGRSDGLPRYRCKRCGKTFDALTKTPMAGLHKKEEWLEHAEAMIDGVSVAKAAERCNVHYTTAFRWRHRFLKSLSSDEPKAMTGIVEVGAMFDLESLKGKRSDLPRPSRKHGGKVKKRGLSAE